jgi:hypothetical protein
VPVPQTTSTSKNTDDAARRPVVSVPSAASYRWFANSNKPHNPCLLFLGKLNLANLRDEGLITDDEFTLAKVKFLRS